MKSFVVGEEEWRKFNTLGIECDGRCDGNDEAPACLSTLLWFFHQATTMLAYLSEGERERGREREREKRRRIIRHFILCKV
jgi:hypothetical protein